MNQEWIKIMKETNRLKLSKGQLFWHYSIVPFLLIVPTIILYDLIQIEVTGTHTGIKSTRELLSVGLLWLLAAVIVAIIQYRRLNFKKLNKHLTPDEFKSISEQAGEEMNWIFMRLSEDCAIAITGFTWTSWGERITIIRKENEILINSICDPDNKLSVSSWGQNGKNINAFKKRINQMPDKANRT